MLDFLSLQTAECKHVNQPPGDERWDVRASVCHVPFSSMWLHEEFRQTYPGNPPKSGAKGLKYQNDKFMVMMSQSSVL